MGIKIFNQILEELSKYKIGYQTLKIYDLLIQKASNINASLISISLLGELVLNNWNFTIMENSNVILKDRYSMIIHIKSFSEIIKSKNNNSVIIFDIFFIILRTLYDIKEKDKVSCVSIFEYFNNINYTVLVGI